MASNALFAQIGTTVGPRGDFDRRGDHHWGMGFVVLVLVVALAVLITWMIARKNASGVSSPRSAGSAETILAERLARGEVSVDDYRTALTALRESSPR